MNIVKEFYENPSEEASEAFRKLLMMDPNQIQRLVKDYFKERELKKYCYLITFTLREDIQDSMIDEVEGYIKKQFLRHPLRVLEAHLVRELTKTGRPHWHIACRTSRPLKKDRFNYYIKKYGFIDISNSKTQTIDESLNYISKCNAPIQIK